jgi:hypothetical protein
VAYNTRTVTWGPWDACWASSPKDKFRLSPALSRVVCLHTPRAHAATVGACKRRSLPRKRGEGGTSARSKFEPPRGPKLVGAVAAVTLVGLIGIAAGSMDSAAAASAPARLPRSPEERRLSHHQPISGRLSPEARPQLDRTGHKRFGKASIYAPMFAGRKMADGTRMRPTSNNAASRTLPLGTTAKVTNLKTGRLPS